jgi:hypothetical protein
MKSSDWRHYRGHLIVKSRGFLGLTRFEVWNRSDLIGTFASVVRAELHVDRVLRQRGEGARPVAGSGT